MHTLEMGLGLPVGIRHPVAFRTGLAGVVRRNKHDRNACQPCLVDDKTDQLSIRPGETFASLALVNLYPFTNAFEIFQDNRGVCAFSPVYDATGNQVVVGTASTRLFISHLSYPAP